MIVFCCNGTFAAATASKGSLATSNPVLRARPRRIGTYTHGLALSIFTESPLRLAWVVVLLIATQQLLAAAQQTAPPASSKPQDVPKQIDPPMQQKLQQRQGTGSQSGAVESQSDTGRSSAYYHYGLAHLYEEMAVNAGRPEYANQAVEEYKLALDADPNSVLLQDGLADLYFRIGRIKDAVSAAQDQVKKNPNDVDAHTLLGQVYLRTLGDMQGAQASEMLQLAITEYETIARLKPDDLETKLLLGQLYALNNDHAKAEAEFKAAQKIDADSEEVILRMAALYSEEGDAQRAADTLTAVPVEAGRRALSMPWRRVTTS